MVLAEDAHIQKSGASFVLFHDGTIDTNGIVLKIPSLLRSFAIRFEAIHLCFDIPPTHCSKVTDSTRKLVNGGFFPTQVTYLYGTSTKGIPDYCFSLGQYFHCFLSSGLHPNCFPATTGSIPERIFRLLAYGIPMQCLPITMDGRIKLENHKTWLSQRKKFESIRYHEYCKGPDSSKSFPHVDLLIAEQMRKMSVSDREAFYFDIHGISETVVEESSERLAQSLTEFDQEISKIPSKEAYRLAESQNRSYVLDRSLRLKFLRYTKFDAKWASESFVQFFEIKLELFGPDKLTRHITLGDLDEEDMACLESGVCTILPLRDRAGRAILCWTAKLRAKFSVQSRVRAM